jgi:hypothetical protein
MYQKRFTFKGFLACSHYRSNKTRNDGLTDSGINKPGNFVRNGAG